ncbi:hypothetical protein RUM43_005227 [Polyplax serrata]|uniref:Muskelin N-terminal domain-containing protein n=1 Tax=Polyplax serrata TaxID=468196 RepID=A0AAN8SEP8_POLSC
MADILCTDMKKLDYSIYKCSSFATSYTPDNIQEDKSNDQSSRWSSETNYLPEFLILKLRYPSLVESITFGKYEKTHICNLKKFKIYGGMTDICSLELLDGGMKNDSTPENFKLKPMIDGHNVPCRFIKIVPLQCWGPSFNFSIWFVELRGIDDWSVVRPCLEWFNVQQEQEVIRLCLKHFRRYNYNDAFTALQAQTKVPLEDKFLTKLHTLLVDEGLFEGTEEFLEKAVTDGYFTEYINKQDYRPLWAPMCLGEREIRPGMRGGHQMCIDSQTETVYLFGGWDGNQDMSDFWSYHVPSCKWNLISRDTEAEGGPSSRSCHKICIDPERRQIFTLGRYLDNQFRTQENLKSDFYMYDIESNTWTLISEDTAHMGGPQLLFDHQMCMDVQKRTIYVFGGRILTPSFGSEERTGCIGLMGVDEMKFSGLYSYHVATNTWTQLYDDIATGILRSGVRTLKCRSGHSMLFHPGSRKLFIFAGQRSKEYLNDFFTYNVDSGEIQQISEGSRRDSNVPGPGFTQRATIDANLNEIYVLLGLSKDKEKRNDNVQHSFWVYSISRNSWTCIYKNENMGENYWNKMQHIEPCPRFAHQLVYDHKNRVHYLFGGNPGRSYMPKLRLDDFWRLHLSRPSQLWLLQKFKFMIRKHRLEELAMENSLSALNYLQTAVSDIIDHEDPEQTKEFQLLAAVLFQKQHCVELSGDAKDVEVHIREQRIQLFDNLVEYFPSHMTQPKYNLRDVIQLRIEK